MFDPTRGKLDDDFDESMRMFEKALVKPSDPIEPRQPACVLLALDGSTQDAAVIETASYLKQRFDCKILFVDAREESEDTSQDDPRQAAAQIPGAELLRKAEGPSYDQVLEAVSSHEPDLVVVPCPFGRDFESIGADSAGTVIDVLLSRCSAPLLIIRRPDQTLAKAVNDISLIVAAESDAGHQAAAWALGLIGEGGSLSLDVVVEKEQFENLKQVLEILAPDKEINPDDVNKALTDSHTALHSAIHSVAFESGISYRLVPKANETAPPLLSEEASPLLIVLPFEVDDRFVHGFVHDRIRRSPHPVLVITTHVKPEDSNDS